MANIGISEWKIANIGILGTYCILLNEGYEMKSSINGSSVLRRRDEMKVGVFCSFRGWSPLHLWTLGSKVILFSYFSFLFSLFVSVFRTFVSSGFRISKWPWSNYWMQLCFTIQFLDPRRVIQFFFYCVENRIQFLDPRSLNHS